MLGLILAALLLQAGNEPQLRVGSTPVNSQSVVAKGTGIPVALINRLSTKNVQEGAGIYAKTVIPISDGNNIVIPEGTMVYGKVVAAERAGRVKGKASLVLSFQSLTFASGVKMPIYASLGNSDTGKRKGEATIEAEPGKDGEDVAVAGARGAAAGAVVGVFSKGIGVGRAAAIGGGAGAAAGLAEALIRRGDDLTLERGTVIEIVLDQDLAF
jgi:type IV secretory pathway VirB10-like protein